MSGSKAELSRECMGGSSPGTLRGAERAARSPQLVPEAGAKPPQPWRNPKDTQHTLLGRDRLWVLIPGLW